MERDINQGSSAAVYLREKKTLPTIADSANVGGDTTAASIYPTNPEK